MVTGCPVETLAFGKDLEEDKLWRKIAKSAAEEEILVTIGTSSKKQEKLKGTGIQVKHSYSILDAKEEMGHKLCCIRNPWGKTEWQGDWSDKSELWNKKTEAAFKPTKDPSDGTFWMSYKDVLTYFSDIDLCYCYPDMKVLREKISIGVVNGSLFYVDCEMKVPEGCSVSWLGCFQNNKMRLDSPPYTDVCVLVTKKGESIPVKSFVLYSSFMHEAVDLDPGEYVIYLFCCGRNLGEKKFTGCDFNCTL
eukprot:UN27664